MRITKEEWQVRVLLGAMLLLNFIFWFLIRHSQVEWMNVPPAPSKHFSSIVGLGDAAFSHRINGITIQNFGDTGGRNIALKDYNYENLAKWFSVEDYLDKNSNFIPYLAAYFFSASQEPKKIKPILDFLEKIGERTERENWRWLAQAAFLARFRLQDMDRALAMANKLSKMENPNLPVWARQMPAFILNAKGEKDAAYALTLEILKSKHDNLQPEEVNSMLHYMCEQILDEKGATQNPLCKNLK